MYKIKKIKIFLVQKIALLVQFFTLILQVIECFFCLQKHKTLYYSFLFDMACFLVCKGQVEAEKPFKE